MKNPVRSRLFSVALASTMLVSVSACAVNPYAEWDAPDPKMVVETYSLPYALAYAKNARDAYRGKLRDQAVFDNLVSSGLITLGAAVLALAAFGADGDAILGVGLAGGTGYTLANRYSNNPQELIYIAGMEALVCAAEAVGPLNFSRGARNDLSTMLDGLPPGEDGLRKGGLVNARAESLNNLASVKSYLQLVKLHGTNPELVQQAQTMVTDAEAIISNSDQTYVTGKQLQRSIDTVAYDLVNAVDRISFSVDKAISESRPRLESLINIIGELSSATNIFAPGLNLSGVLDTHIGKEFAEQSVDDPDEPQGPTQREEQLAAAMGALSGSIAKLSSASRQVAGIVNAVNEQRPLETLEDCGVDTSGASIDITLSTTGINTPEKTVAEFAVLVRGGTSPYVARFLTAPTPGVTIQNPIPGDRTIVVKVDGTATAAQYTLYVADAAGHEQTIPVIISGETPASKPGEEDGGEDLTEEAIQELLGGIAGKIQEVGEFTPDDAVDGTTYTVTSAQLASDAPRMVDLTVNIDPSDGNTLNQSQLLAGVMRMDIGDGATVSSALDALKVEDTEKIGFFRFQSSDTFTPQALIGGDVIEEALPLYGPVVELMDREEVRAVQRALCLPEEQQDGIWGPITEDALHWWLQARRPLTYQMKQALLDTSEEELAEICR